MTEAALDELLAAEHRTDVVVATGGTAAGTGGQGQTAAPLLGWETGTCVSWDEVVTGAVAAPQAQVLVLDDLQDAAAPLTAVKLAQEGCTVTLATRWPMIGMETIPEVYYVWVRSQLYEAGVELLPDVFVREIAGRTVELVNVYAPDRVTSLEAEWIVMATGRRSENRLYHALRKHGTSVEMVGDAIAPRGTYEAVYEGHRAARKL